MNQKGTSTSIWRFSITGWEEDSTRKPGEKLFRSWSYLFEILNELESRKLIHQIRNVYLSS